MSLWTIAADFLLHGEDDKEIDWFEKLQVVTGMDPAEIRPFIENARNPEAGKAFLDEWVDARVADTSNIMDLRDAYSWYLVFGYIDDFWLGLEALEAGVSKGWTNADTLEQGGMVFRHTGYAKHPKYLPRSRATSLVDLWDKRGPPDHCSKASGEWVCE